MSLKCSVLGHRYGEPDVEREREEQGSEVVITITEMETCQRCGETRVVSENKEVTTLETPSDIVGDDLEDDEADERVEEATGGASEAATADQSAEMPEGTTDDAELIDADESDGGDQPAPETRPGEDPPAEEPRASSGDHDEPAAETSGEATATGGGPTGSDPTGADAPDAEDDDAVILEDDEQAEEGEEREPGEWPQERDEDDEDDWAQPIDDPDLRPVEEEQPDIEPTGNAVTVPEGQFYCPECEFTTSVESSSLRAGDFCPECHRGTLENHTGEE